MDEFFIPRKWHGQFRLSVTWLPYVKTLVPYNSCAKVQMSYRTSERFRLNWSNHSYLTPMTPFKVILPFGFILDLRSGLNDRDFDRLLWFIFSFWLVKILPIWLKLDRLWQTLSKELLYTRNESSYILFNAVIYVKQIQIYTRYSSFSVQNLSYSKPIWSSTSLIWRTDLSTVIKTLRIEILGWDWNCQ